MAFRIIAALCFFALASCSTGAQFYQLVNTKPVEKMKETAGNIVYEDPNCIIRYNFWKKGGSTCISFENKTNEDIYLDLGACFFLFNGQSFDLYDGATETKSVAKHNGVGIHWGMGITTSGGTTTQSTVITQQHQFVMIPARTYKVIAETDVTILNSIYRDCKLYLRPTEKAISHSDFSQEDSPYTFGLRLTYYVGRSDDPVKVRNEFYVSRITNYPASMFKQYYTDAGSVCNDEKAIRIQKSRCDFKDARSFYIEYNPYVVGQSPNGSWYKH